MYLEGGKYIKNAALHAGVGIPVSSLRSVKLVGSDV